MSNGIISSNNIPEKIEEEIQPFKVFIRIRPFSEKEKQFSTLSSKSVSNNKQIPSSTKSILLPEENLIFVLDPMSQELNGRKERSFVFDNIFTEKHSNLEIFDEVIKNMVDNILKGYNSTALAYGVTGTGKSHTMFGSRDFLNELSCNQKINLIEAEKGLCIYALDYLFNQINQLSEERTFLVKISYLEIYNEQVIDLLAINPKSLMIVEDSVKGVVVPDLTEFCVSNSIEMMKLVIEGNAKRTMAPTNQNQFSSRSHAIIQVVVEQKSKTRETTEEYIISKFLIVDLAGSERGGLEKGVRTQEGANINKSLLSLGNCINILSDKSKKGAFVPYRDSKLTRLLKDSLGGNILTVMIACVSPSHLSYDETINTLKYATRARIIQKKIAKNIKEVDVHISQYKEIIDSLKNEIDQLKSIIQSQQQIINKNECVPEFDTNTDEIKISKSFQRVKDDSDLELKKETKSNYLEKTPPISNRNSSCNNRGNLAFNQISRSAIFNKNKNYQNISPLRNPSSTINPKNSINIECYKNFLENAAYNLNGSINIDKISLDDKLIEYEVLEKQVENLNSDKIKLEEIIEKSNLCDKEVEEKYKLIKSYYDKYLELINDKLIENIEQNMILKFNTKEIIDLNTTNNQHLNILFEQLSNLENFKLNQNIEESEMEEDIEKLQEEIKSIKIAMEENHKIKERISESLNRNIKIKKSLKIILLKLISNNKENKDKTTHQKYELSFKNLKNEKDDLEMKNKKYQQVMSSLIREKEEKNNQLAIIQNEFKNMRKLLEEKDRRILELENNITEMIKSSNMLNNCDNFIKEENEENIGNKKIEEQSINATEIENVAINLQDDYFKPNINKKSSEKFSRKNSIARNEDITDQSRKQDKNYNTGKSIKYIINQTNNIVNNNINKIINNEKEKKISGTSLQRHNSVSNHIARNNNNNKNHYNNLKNSQRESYSNLNKRSQSKSPSIFKKNTEKIFQIYLNNETQKESKNEIFEKNKQKSNIKNVMPTMNSYKDIHVIRNNNRFNNKVNNEVGVNNSKKKIISDKNLKNANVNKIINESLSISYVSVKDENDFHSELDIMEGIKDEKENENERYTSMKNITKTNKNEARNLVENRIPSPCLEKKKNQIDINNTDSLQPSSNIQKNSPNEKVKNLSINQVSQNNAFTNPQNFNSLNNKNMNMNVQKFLNCNNRNVKTHHSQIFLNNIQKEKPVQPHKRDYSPSPCNLLKQARLEKQLKNKNDELITKTEETNSFVSGTNQSYNNKNAAGKIVSRNSIEFMVDYETNKNRFNTENNQDSQNEYKSEFNKSEIVETVLESVIDLDAMIPGDETENQNKNLETLKKINENDHNSHENEKDCAHDDVLKCLNEVIRNPKITKFLDKK